MGNKQKEISNTNQTSIKQNNNDNYLYDKGSLINRNQFDFLYVLGRGGFGKVWKVCLKKYKKSYALKEMSKAKVIDKRSEKSIKAERDLLSQMKHPFIVNMHYAFQDTSTLYLVMDLLTGGDMRYHISKMNSKKQLFTEEQAKFFIACILLALDYTHTNNILHRDLKPENFVFDSRGYLRLTDYGIAKFYTKENSSETSGTPGYMAPEVMCAQNHTIAVDYFALGVYAFELMFGFRPYTGKSRNEIKEKILAKQVQVKRNDIPEGWSVEAADFINRLLQRKPKNRLGLRGATEVREHPWLKYYPWKDLYDKTLEAPFQHKIAEPWDAKYCNAPDKLGNETKERYENIIRSDSYKVVFSDYFFYYNMDDPNDRSNQKDIKILPNIHNKLQNGIYSYSNSSVVSQGTSRQEEQGVSNQNVNDQVFASSLYSKVTSNSNNPIFKRIDGTAGDIKVMTNIESKFSKIKQMSNSGSASSLLRQYRVSGNTSIGGVSTNNPNDRSSVISQNKSMISNASNSTSTSNQNQNYQVIKKSGSSTYLGK